nr:ABC transporter substrate-binding protein [uncultured Holophaga sp.]
MILNRLLGPSVLSVLLAGGGGGLQARPLQGTAALTLAGTLGSAQAPAGGTRTIRFYGNRSVTVPAQVTRIACGWPAQNAIIAMLGCGDRIVATSTVLRSVPLFQSFVPSIRNAVYCFSSSNGGSWNVQMEELLRSRPQVAFMPESGAGQLSALTGMGIAVVPLRDNSFQAMVERTLITGEILGPEAERRARAYQSYVQANLQRVSRALAGLPRSRRLRVYHSLGADPLATAGAPSLVQDWMDAAGAVNVAEHWMKGMKGGDISLEQLLKADPDVIIAMTPEAAQRMMSDPRWSGLRAVRNHRVYVNPKGMFWWCRETSEEALQVLWVAKTLYPDRFRGLDMAKETRDFYRNFYGCTLTDQQVAGILNPR